MNNEQMTDSMKVRMDKELESLFQKFTPKELELINTFLDLRGAIIDAFTKVLDEKGGA